MEGCKDTFDLGGEMVLVSFVYEGIGRLQILSVVTCKVVSTKSNNTRLNNF